MPTQPTITCATDRSAGQRRPRGENGIEMIDTKELRRLAQAALAGPDGISLNWIKLLQDFQQSANPAAISELLDRLEAAEKENTKLREALAQKVTSETMLRDLSVGNVSINAEQSEISASISLNKLSVKQLKDLLNKMDDSIQLSFTDLKFILEDNHVT